MEVLQFVSIFCGRVTMLNNVKAHLIITGLVQGVYYRVTARQEARTLGITGWVKNCQGGAVEAVIEGNRKVS